jgi:ADP-ribose pyrophosphatase YjhB (NUDIX family)
MPRSPSKMMGYRDWSEMLVHIGRADPSLGDAFVDEQERERRRERHVAVLVEAGVEKGDAEAAIDAVGPTNYGEPRRREDDEQDAAFIEEWGLRPTSRR